MKDLKKILSIKKFIDHPENYSVLIEFWKQTFLSLIDTVGEPYVNNQYGNGKEILDGNPIFTCKIKVNKGIRIIQTEQDIEQPILSSWINKTKINDVDFEELVIALQLKLETYVDVKQLVTLYSNEVLTQAILLGINEKYDMTWDLGKMSYVINQHDYIQTFKDFNSILESSLSSEDFDLNSIKKFNSFHNNVVINLHNHKSPIQRSFNIFIKNIGCINDVLSLKATIDLDKIRDKSKYVFLIPNTWGSTKHYIDKLHSYTAKAEEEYEFLKDNLHI